MADRLAAYYDGIDDLCVRLLAEERAAVAEQLRTAMDGGATSGEILSHTGAVLRSLSDDPNDDIRRFARQLLAECDALWGSTTCDSPAGSTRDGGQVSGASQNPVHRP